MSRARRIAVGSAWLLLGQVVIFVIQFAFVGFTSRVIDHTGFAAYAVALSASALVGLLTNGGIAQAAMRADELSPKDVAALTRLALLLGASGAALTVMLSRMWAAMWGVPSAWLLVALTAPVTLIYPASLLAEGIARRRGQFRLLTASNVCGTVFGVVASASIAVAWRNPVVLLLPTFLTNLFCIVFIQVRTNALRMPRRFRDESKSHGAFTRRVTIGGAMSYVGGNAPKFIVSKMLGPAVLGAWNRAESSIVSPFQLYQQALTQTVYPELRRIDGSSDSRDQVKMTDLLVAVTWLTFLPAIAAAALIPSLLPLLLGGSWSESTSIAVVLALVSAITPITSITSSVLEVAGLFRYTYWTQALQISVVLAVGGLAARWGSPGSVAGSIVLALLLRHFANSLIAGKFGFLCPRAFALGSAAAFAFSAGLYAIILLGVDVLKADSAALVVLYLACVGGCAAVTVTFRSRLPPYRLAQRYGLFQ